MDAYYASIVNTMPCISTCHINTSAECNPEAAATKMNVNERSEMNVIASAD